MPHKIKTSRHIFTLLGALILSACAQKVIKPLPPPVYPPPPAEARFIYDGSLRSNRDIEQPDFGQKLHAFATGANVDPEGMGKPFGIAVKNKRIYITDTQQRSVVVFDLANSRFYQFGIEGQGTLIKPMGITISSQNEIYVVDITAKRIAVYDLDGKYLRELGNSEDLLRPTGITVSPSGDRLYIVDTGGIESQRHRVLIYNAKTGELLKTFGKRGQAHGEFNMPLQIGMSPNGNVNIVDSANFRIQTFDPDGNFIRSFGSVGRQRGQFSRPKGIAVNAEGHIYVSDAAFGNVQIFNAEGQLLLHIGERGTAGGPGRFMLPADVAIDEQGKIYIIDQFFRKIDTFRPVSQAASSLPKF